MLVAAALFAPALLNAQFSELATMNDGGHLYFSSTLRWKGLAPARAESRIYRVVENGGADLYAERGALAFQFGGGSGDGARNPQVSADGQTVALTLQGVCTSADPCMSNSEWRAEIHTEWFDRVLGNGAVFLSGNARWALFTPPPANPFDPKPAPDTLLINLETDARTVVPTPPQFLAHPLASDGSVIVQQAGASGNPGVRLGIWKDGSVTPLILTGITNIWGRSDDGDVLLYSSVTPAADVSSFRMDLRARKLSTGDDITVVRGAPGEVPQFMGVSGSGDRVLYRIAGRTLEGPAFVYDASTAKLTRIALPDGELATDGTLSGLGNVAFLVTTTGRIARVDLNTSRITDAVPPTPYIRNSYQFAPGGLLRLDGTLPHDGAALTNAISLDDRPLPILWTTPQEIAIQTPWELAGRFEAPLRIDVETGSPFQQNELVHVSGMAPRFEGTPAVGVFLPGVAIAEDFSRVLDSDPQPGQVFHMYLTGLGTVQGTPPKTGTPTPASPLFPIAGRITCRFFPYTQDADTLFAGLAPGLTAMYQVTFRMPDAASSPGKIAGGRCNVESQNGGGSLIWGSMNP